MRELHSSGKFALTAASVSLIIAPLSSVLDCSIAIIQRPESLPNAGSEYAFEALTIGVCVHGLTIDLAMGELTFEDVPFAVDPLSFAVRFSVLETACVARSVTKFQIARALVLSRTKRASVLRD